VGQGQERIARHRRVLQLRRRGHARRGGDRRYIALPQQEAFDIEYWLLEEAKLKRMPAEKELARQVIAVVGAGSGIGRKSRTASSRKARTSSCVDLNEARRRGHREGNHRQARPRHRRRRQRHLRLRPGRRPRGQHHRERASIRAMLEQPCSPTAASTPSRHRRHLRPARHHRPHPRRQMGAHLRDQRHRQLPRRRRGAPRLWKEQGLRGSLVLTTSANAVVAKKGSVAYDTSKAAANHLVRELAVELSPLVRVNGVAPATVVQGSAMFPRDRVIASLAKYNIPYRTTSHRVLTTKLAQFYADRTLTKNPITPADQAEAIFLL
jgi:hypothetical protein